MTDGINAISLNSAEKLKLWRFKTRRDQLFPSGVSFCAIVVPLRGANVFKNCFEKLGRITSEASYSMYLSNDILGQITFLQESLQL